MVGTGTEAVAADTVFVVVTAVGTVTVFGLPGRLSADPAV